MCRRSLRRTCRQSMSPLLMGSSTSPPSRTLCGHVPLWERLAVFRLWWKRKCLVGSSATFATMPYTDDQLQGREQLAYRQDGLPEDAGGYPWASPGNPAARRPNSSSPRSPPADWWQRMQFPPQGVPQSPRSKLLQHRASMGGG